MCGLANNVVVRVHGAAKVRDIANANGITNPNLIYAGQRLAILVG